MDNRISIEFINVTDFRFAIQGMRASYNSQEKSDTECFDLIGDRDLELIEKLINNGEEQSKFLRHVIVQLIMRMPRYFWQEFSTYRVGVEMQSESTMHTICKRELRQNDFVNNICEIQLAELNTYISMYNRLYENDIKRDCFYNIKCKLPEGFLQTRYITTNYQSIIRMINQRGKHKLLEWKYFCDTMINELPYIKDMIRNDL